MSYLQSTDNQLVSHSVQDMPDVLQALQAVRTDTKRYFQIVTEMIFPLTSTNKLIPFETFIIAKQQYSTHQTLLDDSSICHFSNFDDPGAPVTLGIT